MLKEKSPRSSRFYWAVRILLGALAYGYIAYRLVSEIQLMGSSVGLIDSRGYILLVVPLLLMPINWGLEAYKWQIALRGTEAVSILTALRGVMLGVIAGLLTPNRVGEPLGRALALTPTSRSRATLIAVWVSSSQLLSTLFFGMLGWVWLSAEGILLYSVGVRIEMLRWVMVGGVAMALIAYLYMERLPVLLKWFPWAERIIERNGLHRVSIPRSMKIMVFLLSLLRYVVFAAQLLIVLLALGVHAPLLQLFAAISTTYLLASLVPSLTISEPAIRASVGVAVLGALSDAHAAIMAAFFIIWIVNIALPAMLALWIPKGKVRIN